MMMERRMLQRRMLLSTMEGCGGRRIKLPAAAG
jgi:hypothetical protein